MLAINMSLLRSLCHFCLTKIQVDPLRHKKASFHKTNQQGFSNKQQLLRQVPWRKLPDVPICALSADFVIMPHVAHSDALPLHEAA